MKHHDLEAQFLRFRDGGDMHALAKVFDAAAPQLMPVAAHLAARRDEADDLIQATFLTAIERAHSYERERPLLPWLLGILALHARKLRQKQGRLLDIERLQRPDEAGPEQLAAAAEMEQAVDSACRDLPPAYSGIVRKHLVDGLEPRELAGELGLSGAAARVRLHRGLKLLRRALPAAFSTGGYAATTSRGIASIREAVLERAALLTGSPVPAAGFAPLGLLLAFLAPLFLAVPAWILWRAHTAAQPVAALLAIPTNSSSSASSAASTPEPLEAFARVESATAGVPFSPAGLPITSLGNAVVRGRVLLPDGSPAVGASVSLWGSSANEERVHEFGLPTNWSKPEPVVTDGIGSFEFSFDAPRAYQFGMKVDHPAAATAAWRWSELLPDSTLDLGEVTLEPCATVVAQIVDSNGNSLCAGWSVSVDVPPPTFADGRSTTFRSATGQAGSSEIILNRLPARRVRLEARTANGAGIEPQVIDLLANETYTAVLRYTGPDPTQRIAVMVSSAPYYVYDLAATQVSATLPGSAALVGVLNHEGSNAFVIDGCTSGPYDIAVSDPRFVPWTQSGVQGGELVRAKLVGNAALRLHLTDSSGAPYVGPYSLRGKFVPETSSTVFTLVDPNEAAPVDGLIGGMLPASYALTLEVPCAPSQQITIAGLAAGELRDVNCAIEAGQTLQGRVFAADGSTPLNAVEVQLTRGVHAGHSGDSGAVIYGRAGPVHRFDQRLFTDDQGRFAFSGLAAESWTVRARWGKYLYVDRTVDLLTETEPIALEQPAHGFLAGRLLFPAGAPIDDTRLELQFSVLDRTTMPGGLGRAGSELQADGSFDFGMLPSGEVSVWLSVATHGSNDSVMASPRQVHSATIHDGDSIAAEIDARASFPGRLREHVLVDDKPGDGGGISWRVPGGINSYWGRTSVDLDGGVLLGSLPPGELRVTYWSKDKTWAWVIPQLITIEAGQESTHDLQLHTTAREVNCIDIATNAALADVEIEWRTGLGGEVLTSNARTDSNGRLQLRMPDQNVEWRCVGDEGAFTTIAWGAGGGPLTVALRRAP